MSDYKHKPFAEEWFTARNDNGKNPQEEHVAYAGEYYPYRENVADNPECPLVVYCAEVEWVPYKRIYEDECGFVEEKLLIHPAGEPVSKVQRLQAAVRGLLTHADHLGLEDFGLTKEDME